LGFLWTKDEETADSELSQERYQ